MNAQDILQAYWTPTNECLNTILKDTRGTNTSAADTLTSCCEVLLRCAVQGAKRDQSVLINKCEDIIHDKARRLHETENHRYQLTAVLEALPVIMQTHEAKT